MADILPTLVTPATARAYLAEVRGTFERLASVVRASGAPDSFRRAFALFEDDFGAFNQRTEAHLDEMAAWLDAKGVSEQIDRYADAVADWQRRFGEYGLPNPLPSPVPSGQGSDRDKADTSGLVAVLAGAALLAAAGIVVGSLAKWRAAR